MKRIVLVLALVAFAGPALAAQTKTYQVTGPVLDVTADTITVQKGNERWEIARSADTKVTGEPQEGRQGHRRVPDVRGQHRGQGGAGKKKTSGPTGPVARLHGSRPRPPAPRPPPGWPRAPASAGDASASSAKSPRPLVPSVT